MTFVDRVFHIAHRSVLAVAAVAAMAAAPQAMAANVISGPPTVLEGDLLRVGDVEVRLAGIDAPDKGQTCQGPKRIYDCGHIAATGLMDLTAGLTTLSCRLGDARVDGVVVATCTLPHGFDLSEQMVYTGWVLAQPGASERLHRLEARSRAAGRGLWRGSVTPPWQWRKSQVAK